MKQYSRRGRPVGPENSNGYVLARLFPNSKMTRDAAPSSSSHAISLSIAPTIAALTVGVMRLPLLLLCVGALAAADPPATPPAADPAPAIKLIPREFTIEMQTQFLPSGEPQAEQRTCRLQLSFWLIADQLRLGSNRRIDGRQIVLTSAETDAGESLIDDQQQHELWFQQGFRGRPADEPSGRMTLSLKAPAKPFSTFKHLAGSMSVPLASGKLRRVDLKPIGPLAGTHAAIEGLDGMELGIELTSEGLTLKTPVALYDLITEVKFSNADGQELSCNNHGGSGNGQSMDITYRLALPADGGAALFLLQNVRMVKIPFDLKDVAIYPSPDRAKATTILKGVEVENTNNVLPAGKSNF